MPQTHPQSQPLFASVHLSLKKSAALLLEMFTPDHISAFRHIRYYQKHSLSFLIIIIIILLNPRFQDTWHKDQLLFDEDQLQSLSAMLVGTSYCAYLYPYYPTELLLTLSADA